MPVESLSTSELSKDPTTIESNAASDQVLTVTLDGSSHDFLQPSLTLREASLVSAKGYLDNLAASTRHVQLKRQQDARRKRKRGETGDPATEKPLGLDQIYLDGINVNQVWEQVRRVLDSSRSELERSLPSLLPEPEDHGLLTRENIDGRKNGLSSINNDVIEKGREAAHLNDLEHRTQEHPSTQDVEEPVDDSEDPDFENLDLMEGFIEEEMAGGSEEDVGMDDEEGSQTPQSLERDAEEIFVKDKHGLNDGFFSIDEFNRQSEFLEQQDSRGGAEEASSGDEEVDWDIDPLAVTSSRQKDRVISGDAVAQSDDDGNSPTFGNADLEASESEEDSGPLEDAGDLSNTNDIKYADFFAPPARRSNASTHHRALPKTQPPSTSVPRENGDDDIQRTISAVRRDIFEDDLTPDEDAVRLEDDDSRSSHQKRQAALTKEIQRLEAAAVAKRDWTLSGEARAAERPINSLLEEDLEFERVGKPIPVITQEVSEDIEAMIKRRIIARDFDEVIRRRPGSLATGSDALRKGRFELEDTKPKQSLAEVYETEHLKAINPGAHVSQSDEKLQREHAKIEQMWKDISTKLDALSSWHYKPKPPSASISVVADVPTITMEDARPGAGGDVGGESMLAPQDIYKAGSNRDKKAEVLTGGGLPVGREEMTREQKFRRRRREKERIRKSGGTVPNSGKKEIGKKAKERGEIVGNLKRSGVKVIGRKGDLRDVEGNAVNANARATTTKGAGGYKL